MLKNTATGTIISINRIYVRYLLHLVVVFVFILTIAASRITLMIMPIRRPSAKDELPENAGDTLTKFIDIIFTTRKITRERMKYILEKKRRRKKITFTPIM